MKNKAFMQRYLFLKGPWCPWWPLLVLYIYKKSAKFVIGTSTSRWQSFLVVYRSKHVSKQMFFPLCTHRTFEKSKPIAATSFYSGKSMLFNPLNTPSLQSSYDKIEFKSHICEKHHKELPACVIITFLTFGGYLLN